MKILNKKDILTKNLLRYAETEKNVLNIMKHPFIVNLNYAFQNENKLFLVLDYCNYYSLIKRSGWRFGRNT